MGGVPQHAGQELGNLRLILHIGIVPESPIDPTEKLKKAFTWASSSEPPIDLDSPDRDPLSMRLRLPAPLLPALVLWALQAGCCTVPEGYQDQSSQSRPVDRPTNVVLFLVDDLGWQDTSLPLHTSRTEFNRRYRTPNVERLAREGVTFTNAYAAAPVCTPTRTSIMTGQDPARTHITYWTLHQDQDTSKKRADLAAPAWRMNGLNQEDETLAGLLQASGYRTIHAGKAHFGAHSTTGADPSNLGFDVNIAGHASGGPASYYGRHNFSVAGRKGNPGEKPTVWDVPGLEQYHGQEIYLTEALTAEVLPQLRAAHADGQPFFLNFCPYAVHAPLMANERLLAGYPDLEGPEAAYATMVESYDRALGAILKELDSLGIADQTLVIFSSDNGGLSAHARGGQAHVHNAPLRSGKGSAYEGGVRVPTVIRWPGVARAGVRDDTPVISQDFFPTVLAAASPEVTRAVDGRDLTELLAGTAPLAPRTLGWNQPHQWGAKGPGIEPFTAIRSGDWKLIYFHPGRRFELYDLTQDLGEMTDQAQTQPGRVVLMADRMQEWIDLTGAQLSIDTATGHEILSPADVARGKH